MLFFALEKFGVLFLKKKWIGEFEGKNAVN